MSSSGNTIGILVPQPSAPAMVSQGSANPPEPLTNAAGPVDVIEMVADVASSALSLVAPDSAAANVADAVSDVVSLASMVPGLPSVRLPSRKMVSGFGGGSGAGSDGGVVTSGHGHCIPCKVAAAIGNPVNAVLGIKVLFDETETDFAFDSPLPLVWQRSYYSDQIGNGWLGQGWSLPFSMRLVRTADGFLYIDEQGREISLPDISDEADEPYSAADDDEDDLYEEEAAQRPASAEEDPYGLDNAYFDPYEQIFFSQISDDLYQIASPDGGARLLFAEVDSGCGIYQLVAQLDRNGRHIRLCYDDNGLPHSIYDGSGRHFQPVFSSIRLHDNDPDFDPAGERDVFVSEDERFYVNRLTSITFNGKELVRYDYDGYGDLTAVYGRDGKKLRGFAYRSHIMVEHNQPDGLVSRYEYDRYDTDGKVLKSSNNLGEEWTFDYRKDHTVVTDALGRTEVYGFDENRELVYRIDADGQRSDSERDDYGRITVERDPLGRETRYLYDTEGNVIAITAPDGSSTQIDYHETLNLPVAVNDPAGRITAYDYDGRGNLISITDPAGYTTSYGYNARWLPETVTDALGKTRRLHYDTLDQLVSFTDCTGETTRFGYTEYGDLETVTDALGHTTRHHYDAAGNPVRTDYPDGSHETFEYDRLNRLTAHIDGLGAKTAYELAVDGLPLKRTNALGHTFAYAYDKARRLTVLTNENGETYRLDYDQTDNLIQETGWDGKITAYGYDAAGQLVQQTEYGQSNHEGRLKDHPETWHIHHFKRNILGQLIEKQSRKVSHKNGQSKDEGISRTRFEYDPITGNLTKARNHHSSVELAYDELDRLIGETTVHNGQSATVGYRYDPLGNRIRTILPDGRHIDYLYYGSGHLHQISLDGEVVSDIERDKLHREIQRTQGSISSLYDYDPMGRLKSQRTVWSGTQTSRGKQNPLAGGAVNRRYAYDKAGNLIQSADQRSGVLNYVYDKIGRIQEARNSQSGRSETFAFDPAHNILSDKAAERKGNNLVSGNRLKEYNGIEYTYDALGNLIYRQLPNGENQYYQYDLENQLVRAEIKKPAGNTEIWTYAYDPFGRRLSKERQDKLAWTSTEPKRTHFVWDGSRLLQEYTYKGSYTYIYTDPDSYEPLAQVFDNAKDGKQYLAYFHNDQIGIPREMTDIHGNLLWYGEYTAWGRLKKDERVYKDAHQPFRLQNQYYDEETGLHYNLMRYYEPEAGRFVNQDPIGLLGGDNLYQFAPNAQTWIDILGLNRFTRTTWQAPSKGTGQTYTVFQQAIDWDMVDNKGRTNLQRASKGLAPLGADGKSINLHHSKQDARGALFELTKTTHSKYDRTNALHPYKVDGSGKHPYFPVDRNAFDKDRKQYWKDRAKAEKRRRRKAGKC